MENINYVFEVSKIESINSKNKKTNKRERFNGYDIKIKCECDSSFLKSLAYGETPDYDEFFFQKDGTLKATFISDFSVSRSISDHKLKIEFESVSENEMIFLGISVNGFKVSPAFGHLYTVKFSVHVEPEDDELLFLNQAVQKDNLKISIIEPSQLAF